ncbi:MAG: hypothetical protein QM765_30070 [Myxococcales bacterium]
MGGSAKELSKGVPEIWAEVGVVDVADATGKVKYQLFLCGYGDGCVFTAGTTKVAASVCQHGFEPVTMSQAEVRAFAAAWTKDAKRRGLPVGHIEWEDGGD